MAEKIIKERKIHACSEIVSPIVHGYFIDTPAKLIAIVDAEKIIVVRVLPSTSKEVDRHAKQHTNDGKSLHILSYCIG